MILIYFQDYTYKKLGTAGFQAWSLVSYPFSKTSPPTPPLYADPYAHQTLNLPENLRMPKRLIRALCIPRLLRIIVQRHSVPMLILRMAQERASHPLISAPSLLHFHPTATTVVAVAHALWFRVPQPALVAAVVRVTATGAAADAEEPEERRGPGEDDAEPGDDHCVPADVDVDVVAA